MNLPIGSYSDPPSSATRLLNCYIEQGGQQGTGPVLNGFPGISTYKDIGTGKIRAAFVMHGVKYVVSGGEVYRIGLGGTVSLLGSVTTGSVRPQIAGNGVQVCFLIEPNAWVYTLSSGVFAQITDSDFTARGASSVQFFDNYISFTEPRTGRWFISDLAAATSFNSLLFATAEGSPDHLVAHVVDHRQALLLGVESAEIWDNAGISGFPFVRSPNGFIEIGCLAPHSAAKIDQSVIWLASDGTVRRLQGITPVRISTHAVEKKIRDYTVASAYSQSFTWDGHVLYVLTFPEATWVYDVSSQQWFELQSYGQQNWRVSCAIQEGGRVYVGDSQSEKLGVLDDVFTEWTDPMVRSWTYSNIYAENRRGIHRRLEMVFQSGVGLATGQGSDPAAMLAFSDDGGESFTDLPTRGIGVQGNRDARAVWNRLGRSTNRVYRGSLSDPVRLKLIGTVADVQGGRL